MKLIFLFWISILLNLPVVSQLRSNRGEGKLGGDRVNWDDQFIIVDKNGASFHSYYEGVEGHPFFVESFKRSSIRLNSGQSFDSVYARLDIFKQTVEIRFRGDTVKTILPGNVADAIFYDTIQAVVYEFRAGYPEIDNLTRNNFYQVLSDGSVELLKSSVKKLNKQKNELSGEISSQFDIYEDYYLYVRYEMKRLKKDKEYLLKLLADKRKELEVYIAEKRLNFKSMDSIIKLIDYYNSLKEAAKPQI